VALASEPAPGGGRPVLSPVWRGDAPVRETTAKADLAAARERAKAELTALPKDLHALDASRATRKLVASDALVREIERLVAQAR
jgi:hypothetical protein